MRKITEQTAKAFLNDKNFKAGNMTVKTTEGTTKMFLHGHCIAIKQQGKISISNCGYETNVTKERLNGIFQQLDRINDQIVQKNFKWFWKDGINFPCNEFVEI